MLTLRRSLVMVCLTCIAAWGCARRESRQTVVTFWTIGTEVEKTSELFADFERENPEIRLRVQQLSWGSAHEKLVTAFVGDALPDVIQLGTTWIPELATLGGLEPLDGYVERSREVVARDYFPGV